MKIVKATLTHENNQHHAFVCVLANGEQHTASGESPVAPEHAIYSAVEKVAARLVAEAMSHVTVKTVATIN